MTSPTKHLQSGIILLLIFFCLNRASGQINFPTIKADSNIVDIRVGDDYFAKGGWILEPDKNPDIFSIGSKWNYRDKRVTFITDLDSISFSVQPGNQYDFIILLHQKIPCHIQIVTQPNPIFMNSKIAIPTLLGFTIILVALYVNKNKIKAVTLLKFGYVSPILFWSVVFISGFIHRDYHHTINTISELGSIGTKTEIFTSASFIFLSVLCLLFSVGFYIASKTLTLSRLPAILSFSNPITLTWAAIFPLGNEFHSLTGPMPLLVMFGSLFAFLLWKKGGEFSVIRILSLFSFILMALIFLRFLRPFGSEYEGLIQRFFYTGWSVWTISISYFLSKKSIA